MSKHRKPKADSAKNQRLTIDDTYDSKAQQKLVRRTNELLESLVQRLHDESKYSVPGFSSDCLFGNGGDSVQLDADTTVAATIVSRITGKFERPDVQNRSRLTSECYAGWIAYEQELGSRKWSGLSTEVRAYTYDAAREFQSIIGSRNEFLRLVSRQAPTLGPGETFISQEGDVSTFSKLNNIHTWTVSHECAPYAALIIAQNRAFRTILNEKFFKKERLRRKIDKQKARPVELNPIFKGYPKNVGLFATRVLEEFFYNTAQPLVVYGSRASSVYKNRVERRGINIEPFWDVVLEKMNGDAIRTCLKRAGYDLNFLQDAHRRMISNNALSTVDFKKASDSILCWLLNKLAGHHLYAYLKLFRATMVLIPGHDNLPASWHMPHKFSSMGNGMTFELLTLCILSFARVVDKTASVYGDDLICRNEHADAITSALQAVGFATNPKKTFIKKPLRESCGGYYLEGYGYITCYDIKWCKNQADVVNTINKLSRIICDNPNWVHPVKELLRETRDQLWEGLSPALFGPRSLLSDLPSWIEHPKAISKQRSSEVCKKLHTAKLRTIANTLISSWQLYRPDGKPFGYTVTAVPVLPKIVKIRAIRDKDVKSVALMYAYLKDCSVTDMLCRSKEPPSVVSFDTLFVFEDGASIRASNAGKVIKEVVIRKRSRRKTKARRMPLP